MNRIALAAILLAAAGLARADAGADVYAKKCAMCHGKDGKGAPVGIKMGAKDLSASTLSEADITKVVEAGQGKMVGFKGKLTDDEIHAVAKYVKGGLK